MDQQVLYATDLYEMTLSKTDQEVSRKVQVEMKTIK